ncbi:MAG TPA: hypothetical protein VHE34_20455 [Puia sp.]|uniref:hypothetical protein n=1 Tax=Puia sp. TaxID=2045100 RepID=UPI002C03FD16|nr:hypothetical protein [Puia sp.]HVU97613.1 hypothetical protein [Puia sp.]
MSFTLEPIINPIVVVLAVVGGALAGFVLGKGKLLKARSAIRRLESDLVLSNAETLEAQKALVALEAHVQEQQAIPVIPMKISGKKDNGSIEKASK